MERAGATAVEESEQQARAVIHKTIQETIGGFMKSINVIEVESRELAAKTNEIRRKIEVQKRGK